MSRSRKPTTIAATIAQFRDQAPPRVKENAAVMKYVMKFFENGVLAGVALVRNIEGLPESERDAAAEALRAEFANAVLMNLLHAINDLGDNAESPQARSGQRGARGGQRGAGPTSQLVPADSADGTPESTAYEELLGKLVGSLNKPKSDCPPPQESPQESPQAREIVKGEGKSGDAKGGV